MREPAGLCHAIRSLVRGRVLPAANDRAPHEESDDRHHGSPLSAMRLRIAPSLRSCSRSDARGLNFVFCILRLPVVRLRSYGLITSCNRGLRRASASHEATASAPTPHGRADLSQGSSQPAEIRSLPVSAHVRQSAARRHCPSRTLADASRGPRAQFSTSGVQHAGQTLRKFPSQKKFSARSDCPVPCPPPGTGPRPGAATEKILSGACTGTSFHPPPVMPG